TPASPPPPATVAASGPVAPAGLPTPASDAPADILAPAPALPADLLAPVPAHPPAVTAQTAPPAPTAPPSVAPPSAAPPAAEPSRARSAAPTTWTCPSCEKAYGISGEDRHRVYWPAEATSAQAVLDGRCMQCGTTLPGKHAHA
ncbi:MAG: hypothetical protein M3P39_08540, partial [Actinomycetota bacterium]|nr:hypothetical protein [Actinomycetota bacterium]